MSNVIALFDFDGTLCNDIDAAVAILNQLADEFQFKKVTTEEVEKMRAMGTRKFLDYLGVSFYKLPLILIRGRQELQKQMHRLKPIRGMVETVTALAAEGVSLGVISSNSEENVRSFLDRHQMTQFQYFSNGSTLFGKARLIHRLLKENGLNPEETYYVGDETRDVEAAKKAGVKAVAVTWGFNARIALAKTEPDYLVEKPQELAMLLNNIRKRA